MAGAAQTEFDLDPEVKAGRRLYGNDLEEAALKAWYDAEAKGFYNLTRTVFRDTALTSADPTTPYKAQNAIDAAPLRGRHYPLCLTLGCGEGHDMRTLGLDIGRIVAVEPATEFWSDSIAGVPAEFRKPTLTGAIDLPDSSVDLVLCLAVLHHVANVEHVVAEFGRVLKPGGRIMIREPIASMGDFRAPRTGLTRNERGIPAKLMTAFLERAGLRIDSVTLQGTPGLPELVRRLGRDPAALSWVVRADRIVSRLLAFNARYWRDRFWKKIAPRSALYLGTRR